MRPAIRLLTCVVALAATAACSSDPEFHPRDATAADARDATASDAITADAADGDATRTMGVDAIVLDTGGDGGAGDGGPRCTGMGTDPYPSIAAGSEATDPAMCDGLHCPGPYTAFAITPSADHNVAQVSGTSAGAASCRFVVVSTACGAETGTLAVDPDGGNFTGPIPLFCGTNRVEIICRNGTSQRVHVALVEGRMCAGDDLRLTLTWDDQVIDGELHLVQAPYHINDAMHDCTWTTCIRNHLYWGAPGDLASSPVKDVDNVMANGTEHITLTRAPAGTYYVLSEHWNAGGHPGTMHMQFNIQGRAPFERVITGIPAHWVWFVGTVTFPGGVFAPSDPAMAGHTPPLVDCTAMWPGPGCGMPIPM